MRVSLQIVLFCHLCFVSKIAQSQHFYKEVYNELSFLQKGGIDTSFAFSQSNLYSQEQNRLLKGLGSVDVLHQSAIFYSIKGKTYILEYISYSDKGKLKTAKSKVLEVQNDTIFNYFKTCISQMRDEEIYPYIFRTKRNVENVYASVVRDHIDEAHIKIFTGSEWSTKVINPFFLEQKNCSECEENLNFHYNVSTKLFEFYGRVKLYCDVMMSKLDFSN